MVTLNLTVHLSVIQVGFNNGIRLVSDADMLHFLQQDAMVYDIKCRCQISCQYSRDFAITFVSLYSILYLLYSCLSALAQPGSVTVRGEYFVLHQVFVNLYSYAFFYDLINRV